MKATEIIVEQRLDVGDSFDIELGNFIIETGIVGFTKDGIIVESDYKTLALLKAFGATLQPTKMSLTESRMAEADILFQDIASGTVDIQQILNAPKDAVERYVSDKLKDFMSDIAIDFELDPEQDTDKIINLLQDRLAMDYGVDNIDDTQDVDSQEPYDDANLARDSGDSWDDPRDLNEAEYQGRKVPLGKPMAGDVKKSKVYVRGPKGNVVKVNFGDKNMKIKKSNPKRRKSFRARHNCDNPGPRWKARYWSCRAW